MIETPPSAVIVEDVAHRVKVIDKCLQALFEEQDMLLSQKARIVKSIENQNKLKEFYHALLVSMATEDPKVETNAVGD